MPKQTFLMLFSLKGSICNPIGSYFRAHVVEKNQGSMLHVTICKQMQCLFNRYNFLFCFLPVLPTICKNKTTLLIAQLKTN